MMNRAERQATKSMLQIEKKRIEEIKKLYERSRKDIIIKITELNNRKDFQENMQTIIYQRNYQQVLLAQIDAAFQNLQEKEYETVDQFLRENYENGYIGTMYSLQEQGIPVTVPLDQKKIVQALTVDSKISTSLYQKMGENTAYLKNSIRAEISRSIANGESWDKAAVRVAYGMNSPFFSAIRKTVTIARTEGHRVQENAALDAAYAAKEKGADQVGQWDAALDEKTRDDHREADGQIRELGVPFDVGGEKLMKPGDGSAKQSINCRCHRLSRARWALDDEELEILKKRAAFFGLDKSKDFEEYRIKFLNLPDNADTISIERKLPGGQRRRNEYEKRWTSASLANTLKKLFPDLKSDMTVEYTQTGKLNYTTEKSNYIVCYDTEGDYFRIEDKRIRGKRKYLDLALQEVSNIKENGRYRGRSKHEYESITHFINSDTMR